jgi:hypothetical protein
MEGATMHSQFSIKMSGKRHEILQGFVLIHKIHKRKAVIIKDQNFELKGLQVIHKNYGFKKTKALTWVGAIF